MNTNQICFNEKKKQLEMCPKDMDAPSWKTQM